MSIEMLSSRYDIPFVESVAAPEPAVSEASNLGLIEMLLKRQDRLDALVRDEKGQADLIPRFLAVALFGYTVFAVTMVLILYATPASALPQWLPVKWSTSSAVGMFLAYDLGMIAAVGVCLPSFYFYSLLAGIRITMLQITGQVMKGAASTALMLLGILPIYVAVMLGMIVFGADQVTLEAWLYMGLTLPAVAGLWGVWSIYIGVMGFVDTLSADRRCRRRCFLRRLTLAWAGCYMAVMPVMVYTLWRYFGNLLG